MNPDKRDVCVNCDALDWKHTESACPNDGSANEQNMTRFCGHCGRVEWLDVAGWHVLFLGKNAEKWDPAHREIADRTWRAAALKYLGKSDGNDVVGDLAFYLEEIGLGDGDYS